MHRNLWHLMRAGLVGGGDHPGRKSVSRPHFNDGEWGMTRWLILWFVCLGCVAAAWSATDSTSGPLAKTETDALLPGLRAVKQRVYQAEHYPGRMAIRYEHEHDPRWGYDKQETNFFNLILPNRLTSNPPLLVALHWAGGAADADAFPPLICAPEERNFYGDGTFYALTLSSLNGRSDYGWKGDPMEKRVLATIEWVVRTRNIDRNRIYFCGASMGGAGTLGIGFGHGEIFAAIAPVIPAGGLPALNREIADPPPIFCTASHLDTIAGKQDELIRTCRDRKYALCFNWGPFGHTQGDATNNSNSAAYDFPWLEIRRDEAYPVFTGASTDDEYPKVNDREHPNQTGQINGYFRWRNIEDTPTLFAMELNLVRDYELRRPIKVPREINVDVSLRRVQHYAIAADSEHKWSLVRGWKTLASGTAKADAHGLLTIRGLTIRDTSALLIVGQDSQRPRGASKTVDTVRSVQHQWDEKGGAASAVGATN